MPEFRNATPLAACALVLMLGAAHAANGGGMDDWPAYPLPADDSQLDAHAVRVGLRPSFVACLKNGGDEAAATACISAEYPYQERRLDRSYRTLVTRLDRTAQVELRDEQGRWMRWREGRCNREEIELAVADCMLEMDADRATQLEGRLAEPERKVTR